MRHNISMILVNAFPAYFPCAENLRPQPRPAATPSPLTSQRATVKPATADIAKRLPPIARILAAAAQS